MSLSVLVGQWLRSFLRAVIQPYFFFFRKMEPSGEQDSSVKASFFRMMSQSKEVV